MPKIGFGLAVWLRDEHPENVYRALDELTLAGFDGVEFNPVERWYGRPQEFKAMGDFDVYETLGRYKRRIGFVHFKDLDVNRDFGRTARHGGPKQPSDGGAYGMDSKWRFVELGRGIIDFPRAWSILQSAGYDGWIVDDFDDAAYPAYQSALACRKYLKEAVGV